MHVALATTALVQITFYFCKIPFDAVVTLLVFCGTSASYNIIKYLPYVLNHKKYKKALKAIIVLTVLFLIACSYLFLHLNTTAQFVTILFCLLSAVYVVPFSKSIPNLRNFAGIKIYIVSICWAGVTILLPMVNAEIALGVDVLYKFLQRFILTLLLILIFEINDLKYDPTQLQTVPQRIGVKKTKWYIYSLLPVFYALEFLKQGFYPHQWIINLILCILIFLCSYFVNERRSKYYTLFWVESLPVVWYLLILFFNYL